MNRRDAVFAPLGLGAGSLLGPVWGQTRATGRPYRIALVPDSMDPESFKAFVAALHDAGRIEGRDFVLIREGLQYGQAIDILVKRALAENPDLVIAGGTNGARAFQQSAPNLPVVLWGGGLPLQAGIIDSLAHPGRSVTGITMYGDSAIMGKYLQLLQEVKPTIRRVGVIWSQVPPASLREEVEHARLQFRNGAQRLKLDVQFLDAAEPEDVDAAISQFNAAPIDALVLPTGRATMLRHKKLIEFMAQKRLPTLTDHRWYWSDPMPLLCYSAHFPSVVRQAAGYVDRILWGGSKPGELPMQQPTKFELVVNLKTAKAIGIALPQSLLLRADEVIQ